LLLACLGAVAGIALYALVEIMPDLIENKRLTLFLIAATGGFFSALLAASGPLRFTRAALAAAVAALPAAGLLTWASFRFASVDEFYAGYAGAAFVAIVTVSLPFLIAAQRPGEGWNCYPALFTQAWNIVVRYAAAWLFVGVFWLVVLLSHLLFGLVGLTVIQDILNIDAVPYLVTGAVLGLALAVVVELADYISPFLVLRLLRLLLPLLLPVVVVFLAALPIQGLSNLFGGLSAAATLLAVAVGIATLITSSIDRDDSEAAATRVLQVSAQVLSLALPVLAGLGGYAVWLRVAAYGWTPDRIAAMAAAAGGTGYAVLYALAVLRGRGWMARIRTANLAMALVLIALSVLWLTPAIDPQRISANDQVARLLDGRTDASKIDLWFLGHDLGLAGAAAIDRLETVEHPQREVLRERIARLRQSSGRYDFAHQADRPDNSQLIADITARIAVLPAGTDLPADLFDGRSGSDLARWAEGCARKTPEGRAGCLLVLADFVPSRPGDEALFFWMPTAQEVSLQTMWSGPGAPLYSLPVFLSGSRRADVTPQALDALLTGTGGLRPATVLSLSVVDAQITLHP